MRPRDNYFDPEQIFGFKEERPIRTAKEDHHVVFEK